MNLTRKWSIVTAGALALSLMLSACGKSTTAPTPTPAPGNTTATGDTGTPVDGGTLTWATTSDITTLNPMFIDDTTSQNLANLLFAGIIDLDPKGQPIADDAALAAEVPTVSADGLTYTVKLKTSPKWTDGKPVTADDLIWTFNTYANPKVGAPAISSFDKVAEIKKVNENTVEIKLKEVYAPFMVTTLTSAVLPSHILKDVPAEDLKKNPYGTEPAKFVSNGPYKWGSWTQAQQHTLEADPNFWGTKKAHIKTIVYKMYADQNTQVQALVKGEADMMEQIPVATLPAAEGKPDIKLVEGPGPVYDYFGFNFNKENWPDGFVPFAGKATRQALAHAINRQGMVDSVLKKHGVLLNGPFLPGSVFDAGTAKNYDYNVDTAKKLLADDGWKAGPDGILVKDGHKFEFKLQFNTGNKRRESVGAVIQANLKAVGINVILEPLDFAAWIKNNINPGKYQAVLLGWSLTTDPDNESIFSSKYFPEAGQNSGWYKNELTDKLWVDGYKVTDPAKRREVYGKLAAEMTDDLPYVFLYQQNLIEGLRSRVKYAEADKPVLALPYGTSYHMQYWWVSDATK
jgi:peptide/nickel transport system substrate-binding protein